MDGVRLACVPAVTCNRASGTATACTGRTSRRAGQRCNPNKLLLDPYAKAIDGQIDWDPSLFAYDLGDAGQPSTTTTRLAHMMYGVVINPFFDWAGDRAPKTPYAPTR